jgi:hypothetical protein
MSFFSFFVEHPSRVDAHAAVFNEWVRVGRRNFSNVEGCTCAHVLCQLKNSMQGREDNGSPYSVAYGVCATHSPGES